MSVKVHEPVCEDSAQDLYFWFDHFLGDQVKDEWRVGGTGSAVVVDAQTGGIVRITTGGALNDNYALDWGDIRSLLVTKKVTMEIRLKLTQITYLGAYLRLLFDADNNIGFYFEEGAGGAVNWGIVCENGGIQTTADSGETTDTNYHIFRIECFPTDEVHFYIDGEETAGSPITTNIPDDVVDYLQPHIILFTRENATKSMDMDYVVVRQER